MPILCWLFGHKVVSGNPRYGVKYCVRQNCTWDRLGNSRKDFMESDEENARAFILAVAAIIASSISNLSKYEAILALAKNE